MLSIETSTLYYIFTIFNNKWVCNTSNKYWLPNELAKYMFLHKTPYIPPLFQKEFALSISEAFINNTFYHMHTNFHSWWDVNVSNKYKPPSNLAKSGALHCKPFWKHPLFTILSSFLTVSEVCNTSNQYWLPNESAKK